MSGRFTGILIVLLAAVIVPACSADSASRERLFIIGQDLGSVRDYVAADAARRPTATPPT